MDEARLFLAVCSDRTRNNCLKLEHRKFQKNMQMNFFTVKVTEHWNMLPREEQSLLLRHGYPTFWPAKATVSEEELSTTTFKKVAPKVMSLIYFHGNYERYKEHNNAT